MLFFHLCSTNDNSVFFITTVNDTDYNLLPLLLLYSTKTIIWKILPAQIISIMLHLNLSLTTYPNYRQIKWYETKIPYIYCYPEKVTFTFNTGLFTPYLDTFPDLFLAWFLFKLSTVYPCPNRKQFHPLRTS